MRTLVLANKDAAQVYASMCEGIWEVWHDDRDQRAGLMSILGFLVEDAIDRTTAGKVLVLLEERLAEVARLAMENCLDNGAGRTRDEDPDFADFLRPDEVELLDVPNPEAVAWAG